MPAPLAAVFLCAACLGVPPPPAGLHELVDLPESLPKGPAAASRFLAEADVAWQRRDDPAEVETALQGYWRAVAADPREPAGYWKAARACVLLGQLQEGKEKRAETFLRGLRTTQLLLERDDSVAEAHYYYALNLGLLAQERPTRGHEAVKEMLPHLERTAQLDPDLDGAGAYRTMALVYLRAPGWPTSVGDEAAGLDYARRAVERFAGHPGNRLALAEALQANGKRDRARAELDKARELAAGQDWTGFEREDFGLQAAALEKQL